LTLNTDVRGDKGGDDDDISAIYNTR
jgi:hypothetical protein